VYPARDRVVHEAWIEELATAADALDLDEEARSVAVDLFLQDVPTADRSKRAVAGASLYAAALITGQERSQGRVASVLETSRVSVQQRWKQRLRVAGFDPPSW